MKRRTAAAVLAAGVIAGGAGTALTVPGIALAADRTTSTSVADRVADRVTAIKDALKGLVSNGTITQAQADKVATTLAQSDPRPGRGGHGPGGRLLTPEATAQVLGVTVQQLHDAQESGKTLAQIAASKGISKTDLITKLVAAAKTQLAADLKAQRITQAQYDAVLADLQSRITNRVDQVWGPGGGHGPRGFGDHDRSGPGPATASPAPSATG
jgi:hypothetical protein